MSEKKIVVRRSKNGDYVVRGWISWTQRYMNAWTRWMVKGLKPGKRRTITLSYEEKDDE